MITPFQKEPEGAGNTDVLNPNHSCDAKFNESTSRLQVVADRMDAFKRLEQGFRRAGWALYPLSDDSMLATYARWGLSQVLPDARAAAVLLRKIGGAA